MRKARLWWASALVAAIVVCFLAFFSSMVSVGYAATTVDAPNGLSASYDGPNNSWVWNASSSQYTGSVTASSSTKCSSTTYTEQTTTLTLRNSSSDEAQLVFSYTKPSSGTLKINGTSKTSAGTFDQAVAGNGTVTIALTSPKSSSAATVTLSSFSVSVPEKNITTTFSSSALGSYTVSGDAGYSATIQANGASVTHEQSNQKQYTLTATPADGYQFVSWKSGGESFSTQNPFTGTLGAGPITPFFVISGAAKFLANSKEFYDLNEANTAASGASTKTIKLVASGVVPAGTYTISSGVTLFLPTSSTDNTIKTTTPSTSADAWVQPTEYLRLTLLDGCSITCKGSISIPSLVCRANGAKETGAPSGPSSRLFMSATSTISLESGGNLYCWGFIYGTGTIHAKSGAKVYECFQLPSWKGGTAMSNILSSCKSNKVFPCNSYYVQNIEANLRIDYGATETVYFQTTVSISTPSASIDFISASKGMFQLGSGSYVIKHYDATTDRLIVDVYGNVSISSFSFSVYVTVNSGDYVLPLNTNMSIHIHQGITTLNSGQDLCFFPATELVVDEGATFKVSSGANVYFYAYNSETFGNYLSWSTTMQKIAPVIYTPSNGKSTATGYANIRTLAHYKNARVEINGTMEVSGQVFGTVAFETASDVKNAIVSSTGNGIVRYASSSITKTSTTKQLTSTSPTFDTINVQALYLINGSSYDGDASIQATIAQSEYYFSFDAAHPNDPAYGYWKRRALGASEATIHFFSEDGSEELFTESPYTDEEYTMPKANHVGLPSSSYMLKGWRDSTDTYFYETGETVTITTDFNGRNLYAFYGGWYKDTYYPRDYSTLKGAFGLFMIPAVEPNNVVNGVSINGGDVCLFSSAGKITMNDPTDNSISSPDDFAFLYSSSAYSGRGDDQIYHIKKGLVQNDVGLVSIGDYYYYFGSDHTAYKNGDYWINSTNLSLPSGQYHFDENGHMDTQGIGVQMPSVIMNGNAYFEITQGNETQQYLAYGWGLFALDGNLYYALNNGSIARDTTPSSFITFYVEKTNGCLIDGIEVVSGTYYFDNSGRMYDSSLTLVTTGSNP